MKNPSGGGPQREDGQTHYGRYEIVRKLATGGMGEVYLAKSRGAAGFQKHVVIKKILPHLTEHMQFVAGLVREAKLLVLLEHPNIVQVLDLGREGTDYFMAMEYVHGYNMATIAHYCAQKRVLIPQEACVYIALQVLAGLEYAHEIVAPDGGRHNIIHRDVSPQNVLISQNGRVKLTDFGIAKVLNEAEAEVTQSLKGKFRYMAPEAVDGGRIDQRYDLFAVGILLFEALCRRHLFGGRSDVEILKQVRDTRVPPIVRYHPGVSPAIVAVTERALMREPEERYQTAAEFAADLRDAIGDMSENEAGRELKRFIEELYERDDFPINKPKMPDLNRPDPNVTRSLVLTSDIPVVSGHKDAAAATPAQPRRGGSRGMLALSLGFLLISGVVAYLAYALLVKKRASTDGAAKNPVIIKVEKRAGSGGGSIGAAGSGAAGSGSALASAGGSGDGAGTATGSAGTATGSAGAAHGSGKGTGKTRAPRRVVRRRPAVRFTERIGARTFARHQRRLQRCFKRHIKAGAGTVALRVISTIRASGVVSAVKITPPERASSPLGRCIRAVALKIRYPRHDKEQVKFVQPLRVRMQ